MSEMRNFGKNTGKPMVCPICRNEYIGRGSVSRTDNTTIICTDCGTRQALKSIGVSEDEQDKILAAIHSYKEGKNEQ